MVDNTNKRRRRTQHVFVNFAMSEGTSEASAAKKRKLGQRFRPEYSSLAL